MSTKLEQQPDSDHEIWRPLPPLARKEGDALGQHCQHCNDQGWYVVPNRNTGEPEQEQCEWCNTNPDSIYNRQKTVQPAGADTADSDRKDKALQEQAQIIAGLHKQLAAAQAETQEVLKYVPACSHPKITHDTTELDAAIAKATKGLREELAAELQTRIRLTDDQISAAQKPLVDELQNIVNCDLSGMRKDFGSDTDRQFRLWAQSRAKAALAKVKEGKS